MSLCGACHVAGSHKTLKARFGLRQPRLCGWVLKSEACALLQIVGVIFPVLIMALVPIRQYILPRFFSQKNLQELDAAEYEEAPPMRHEEVAQEAAEGDVEMVRWERKLQSRSASTLLHELMRWQAYNKLSTCSPVP